MYYPSSENKGADQLRGYREADLRLCFRICKNPVFSRRGSYINDGKIHPSQAGHWLADCIYMSRDVRKPVFRVSDQVRHKPGCTATEDG